jgi:hypothetical protein
MGSGERGRTTDRFAGANSSRSFATRLAPPESAAQRAWLDFAGFHIVVVRVFTGSDFPLIVGHEGR